MTAVLLFRYPATRKHDVAHTCPFPEEEPGSPAHPANQLTQTASIQIHTDPASLRMDHQEGLLLPGRRYLPVHGETVNA